MDKVIIFGTYHFLGFSLCEKLLDEGIQVDGFRFLEDLSEEFLEEKKLLIGRNANFEERTEVDEERFSDEELNSEIVIIISFYDLFYRTEEKPISLFENVLKRWMIRYQQHQNIKLICIFPLKFLSDFPKPLTKQLNSVKERGIPIQSIFLPTIYGPWQSSVFLFQQYFSKEHTNSSLKLDPRECTIDAIYIDDLLKKLKQLISSSEESNFIIQSNLKEQWFKGAKHLQLEDYYFEKQDKHTIDGNKNLHIIRINESMSIEEGLEQQRRHLSRLM